MPKCDVDDTELDSDEETAESTRPARAHGELSEEERAAEATSFSSVVQLGRGIGLVKADSIDELPAKMVEQLYDRDVATESQFFLAPATASTSLVDYYGTRMMPSSLRNYAADAQADLATPDPATVRFQRRNDPARGQVWDIGQYQGGKFVVLQGYDTIRYLPVDPPPGVPYGRPPVAPALFTSLFLLGLLHDLRRVIAQQGYPRYDLVINMEQLLLTVPPMIRTDPAQMKAWVDAAIAEVQSAYDSLQPDDAFVHTDVITVNKPTGAVSTQALSAVDGLIRALERLLARAVKSMPLLMGNLDGSSEANANRQWELQAAGVKAIQHLSETALSDHATMVCEAGGIAAQVVWKFHELRAAELYRDAMTTGLRTDNAVKAWLMGWSSQEEASIEATGHTPDQKEPRFLPSGETPMAQKKSDAEQSKSAKADGSAPGDTSDTDGTSESDTGDSKDPAARDIQAVIWPSFTIPSGTAEAGMSNGRANGNGRH